MEITPTPSPAKTATKTQRIVLVVLAVIMVALGTITATAVGMLRAEAAASVLVEHVYTASGCEEQVYKVPAKYRTDLPTYLEENPAAKPFRVGPCNVQVINK